MLRLDYVEGATPAKWIRAWKDRKAGILEYTMVAVEQQLDRLLAGESDLAIVRLPLDTGDLHLVRLYEENEVMVVSRDHAAAAFDSLALADFDGEAPMPRGEMTYEDLVAVVASGAGIARMPQPLARLHARKDVHAIVLTDGEKTPIALAWRRERDADDIQTFVGITKGRTSRSTR